jgi:IMP dehydrogenase
MAIKTEATVEQYSRLMEEKFGKEGLTFDDVLLCPEYSEVLPTEVDTHTRLTRGLTLSIPILSAAMDTVTESRMAIALAREGGVGMIHRNMPIDAQVQEVDRVKRWESGMILKPLTLPPDAPLSRALELMDRFGVSGIPITELDGRLVGILTNRDMRFAQNQVDQPIASLMTRKLVTAPIGTTLDEARAILHEHKIEKLPIVDGQFHLRGLITVKDIQKKAEAPRASKDKHGRLLVGAAVGVSGDSRDRVDALVSAEVDVICIDTAHGHSRAVLDMLAWIKERHHVQVIAGNIATPAAAEALIKAGADAIKVGMGPGSICTTRVVSGVGVPQITAIFDCAMVAREHDIPVIADGGITLSGDITKAIVAGADAVMMGSMFAGTEESPGEVVVIGSEHFKEYRGMGSVGAMKQFSRDRYGADAATPANKLVPEGIEAMVPYKGALAQIVHQLVGGLRAGMGYLGAKSLPELKSRRFMRITPAGMRESHTHDVMAAKKAPNYQGR